MIPVVVLTLIAIACLLAAGYLLGVRRGQAARGELVARLEVYQAEIGKLHAGIGNSMQLLAPMLERERLGTELSRIETGSGTLRELPRILDSIAEKGGFTSLVLGDEVGLPLAATTGARDVEVRAGSSALLLSLSDRLAAGGAPPLVGVVVQDESHQTQVHRVFRIRQERYVLAAQCRGQRVGPDALDAALPKVEEILARR